MAPGGPENLNGRSEHVEANIKFRIVLFAHPSGRLGMVMLAWEGQPPQIQTKTYVHCLFIGRLNVFVVLRLLSFLPSKN